MRNLKAILLATTVALSLCGASAVAYGQAAREGSFSVQNFQPALGPRNWLTVEGARVEGRLGYSVGMFMNYQRDPFVIYTAECRSELSPDGTCPGDDYRLHDPTSIVENQFQGDVMVTLSLIDRLQVGLDLPVVFMTGNELNVQTGETAGELSAVGLSDPRLQGKYRFIGNSQGIAVAGSLTATVPFAHLIGQTDSGTVDQGEGSVHTAGPNGNLGSSIPQFVPKVILDFRRNRFEFGANLGADIRYRAARLFSSSVGTRMLWGLAGGYQVAPKYRVLAEFFGVTTPSFTLDESPMEVDAAFQAVFADITMTIGGGTGIVRGVGSPLARGFVGALYSPQRGDRDHDGTDDKQDTCPDDPEDEDGFLDSDGCPEEDNDADGKRDGQDRCPNEAEDTDEYQDEDGCPDTDDDGDGIPDGYDSCRREAEDMDGDRDDDGCPDNDSDGDGINDPDDRCVNEPEDTDGYTDEDGCPETDNDNDGVPDETDECGEEAEDRDGFEDENGCPDRDNDGDAVPDAEDACRDSPGRPQFRGCATAAEARRAGRQ